MLDLNHIVNEAIEDHELLFESSRYNKVGHIFNDQNLTFGEIRDMFRSIFSGNTELCEKVDGINVSITYKDGEFRIAKNKSMLKDPIRYSHIGAQFDGCPRLRDAFINSANDLSKALNSLQRHNLDMIFNDGKNFLNIDIIYPPARNVMDYGNKCILQLNSLDIYDDQYNKLDEDEELRDDIFQSLKTHNALRQELFEISKPNVLRIKDSVDASAAYDFLISDLDQLVDGIGYNATIQDYVNTRLKKHIVNCAMKEGLDVDMNSDFVNAMVDRISCISHRRPTKTDLICYAKKEGINPRSNQYANLFTNLHNTSDCINEQIMLPIESLVIKASNLLFKNLVGFMAADPNKNSQRIVSELEDTIHMVESDDQHLTREKLRRFRKHMKKIQEYQNESTFPTEGVMFKYTTKDGKSKVYKLIGNFGAVNQIMNLIRR